MHIVHICIVYRLDGMSKMDFLVALTNDAVLHPIYKNYFDFALLSLLNRQIQFLNQLG